MNRPQQPDLTPQECEPKDATLALQVLTDGGLIFQRIVRINNAQWEMICKIAEVGI